MGNFEILMNYNKLSKNFNPLEPALHQFWSKLWCHDELEKNKNMLATKNPAQQNISLRIFSWIISPKTI